MGATLCNRKAGGRLCDFLMEPSCSHTSWFLSRIGISSRSGPESQALSSGSKRASFAGGLCENTCLCVTAQARRSASICHVMFQTALSEGMSSALTASGNMAAAQKMGSTGHRDCWYGRRRYRGGETLPALMEADIVLLGKESNRLDETRGRTQWTHRRHKLLWWSCGI